MRAGSDDAEGVFLSLGVNALSFLPTCKAANGTVPRFPAVPSPSLPSPPAGRRSLPVHRGCKQRVSR